MIEELYAEKDKLERVIAALELIQGTETSLPEGPRVQERRGRKSMGLKERHGFAHAKYWADRRPDPDQEVGRLAKLLP